MSGNYLECPVCEGYGKYKDKECFFCDDEAIYVGNGIDSLRALVSEAEGYMDFVDKGGDPKDWEG